MATRTLLHSTTAPMSKVTKFLPHPLLWAFLGCWRWPR
jgi:hypothetical protein